MALQERQDLKKIEINLETKIVKIVKKTVITKENKEIAYKDEIGVFTSIDLEEAKSFLGIAKGPIISYLEALWEIE